MAAVRLSAGALAASIRTHAGRGSAPALVAAASPLPTAPAATRKGAARSSTVSSSLVQGRGSHQVDGDLEDLLSLTLARLDTVDSRKRALPSTAGNETLKLPGNETFLELNAPVTAENDHIFGDEGVHRSLLLDGLLSEIVRRDGVQGRKRAGRYCTRGDRWLQERLGLSEQRAVKIMLAAPGPFSGESADVAALNLRLSWLRKRLRLNKGDIRKVARGFPRIFAASVETDLEPRLEWLKVSLGLDKAAIRKLVVTFPTLFSKNVEDGLERKLLWLELRLGMRRGDLSKVVVKYPTLLSYSIEENLEPRIRWLENRLGLDDEALRKMVIQFPAVFGYSIEDNLEPKLKWLQSELALDLEGCQRLVRLAPPILGASIDDNLKHKLCRLQELLGMTREKVVGVLVRKPALLALDADKNIEPKVRFFLNEMGATPEDVRQALEANSSLLMYSLEKRWRPRLARMHKAKIRPVFDEHWRAMATRGEAEFEEWLVGEVSESIGAAIPAETVRAQDVEGSEQELLSL